YQGVIQVGPVPVPVYATFPIKAGIHITGSLNAGTFNIASTTVAHAAAGFDENAASLTEEGSNVWLSGGPSVSGSAKLSASIGIQAGVGVAKGANVHVEADFGPVLSWSSGKGCAVDINMGSLSAGVTILGKEHNSPSITPFKWHLWDGCPPATAGGPGTAGNGGTTTPGGDTGPGTGTVGSPGSGSGDPGTTVPAGSIAETVGGVTHTWTNYANAGGSEGATIPSGQTVGITCKIEGFRVADGNTWWYKIASAPWNGGFYASADAFYNNGQTSGPLQGTPFVDPAVPDCAGSSQPGSSAGGRPETAGGVAHTWTNYSNAGGTQGPTIQAHQTVDIACKLTGFKVADGNTWWYKIASAPWNGAYYVSADAFYNNGQTSGSLQGTPFVDGAVPDCSSPPPPPPPPPPTWAETTGGVAHTWTNYTNAGGTQGPSIGSNQTVQIACKLQGFRVADGNTWWYRIASAPWSSQYYVSADAFYNNGQTSGSLHGTPFVDPAVGNC
ncbi:MAG TPA: hypothetical protein VI300_05980, partial [Solirubrobacter sp.]